MKGYYHSKETFGTVDGPGIRYVLFLAGCQLGCSFCHNPDTWMRGAKTITVDEVVAEVKQYQEFYRPAGGGITVSGGEALLQPEFTAKLFQACKTQGIHTVLDTAGFCARSAILAVLPYVDQVLFSLKAVERNLHRQLTVADNLDIIENFRYIVQRKPTTLRYVVIPDVNDRREDVRQLIDLIISCGQRQLTVDLLAYHTLGVYKWQELGKEYQLSRVPAATPADVARVRDCLIAANIAVEHS